MSGFSNPERKTFVHIKKGLFHIKTDGPEGANLSIKKDDGSTVYYQTFRQFVGRITGFSTKVDEYNGEKIDKFCISLTAEGKQYQVDINQQSGTFRRFVQQIVNADPTKEVTLQPVYEESADGKKRSGIFIKQGDQNMKFSFTKENPGGCPELEVIKLKGGKEILDSTEQTTFFLNQANSWASGLTPPAEAALMSAVPADEEEIVTGSSDDDLPF